jgi:hypothetical protein
MGIEKQQIKPDPAENVSRHLERNESTYHIAHSTRREPPRVDYTTPHNLGMPVSHAPTSLMHGSRPQGHTRHAKPTLSPCSQEHTHSAVSVDETFSNIQSFPRIPKMLINLCNFQIVSSVKLHTP